MKALIAAAMAFPALALAGCATTGGSPVQVTRFNIGEPLETGTLAVQPMPGGSPASLEFKTYAAAVQTEALKYGYGVPAAGEPGQFLAIVGFARTTEEDGPAQRSGVSLGLGGGGFTGGRRSGGGVGLGGGISFPIGKPKQRYVILTELSVQIKRRSDSTVVWEGRARTATPETAAAAQADVTAHKLADALFRGFPGKSGSTITVR
ncbi:hypothetical protein PX554_22475 [Sphingomonas sp. H39-1-10]|uniref:hypothetical protein n=1 Tax=Sphingomonas TaxID=13687 RepID=UPI000891DAB3|nr:MULTISPECIES: hypothetical protein [Sphingomonas]MDF0490900.1 hypothetical protein [Sphingomonas pollutisoli]SDA21405.1 hypothetical protein SAMN03159340_01437 [Sphingomonas sp. NFR15]